MVDRLKVTLPSELSILLESKTMSQKELLDQLKEILSFLKEEFDETESKDDGKKKVVLSYYG